MASELPSFFPATLAKAYRSDERDRPASAAQLSASGSPLLDCELVCRYRKQIGAACAYTLVAAIVFGVGYLGAYVVAAESTGVALGVTLGGMLPLCIVLGCCALGIDQSAAAGVVVAGAAIMVIIIPTGLLWKPAYALKALDTYHIPVDSSAPLPAPADSSIFRFAEGPAALQTQCTPHSTDEDPWCAAPISAGRNSLAHFVAVGHDCCEKGKIKCRGWDLPLRSVQAVQVALTRPSSSDDIGGAVMRALVNCNVTLMQSAQRVVLYDDVDSYIASKMAWGWVIAACVSVCWAPVGGLVLLAVAVMGKK